MSSYRKAIWTLSFILLSLLLSPGTTIAAEFTECPDMFAGNIIPTAHSKTIINLCKFTNNLAIFAIRFDTARKTPNWVAHRLSPDDRAHLTHRNRPRFYPDSKIPSNQQATDKSYVRSGFSRGHIVPAYDMSWNAIAYKSTFGLSNVVPQKQSFNAGPWLGMENAFRKLVKAKNITLWDISGVYGQITNTPAIGTNPHTPVVPKCFYKIIIAQGQNKAPYKVLAALFRWNDFGTQKSWQQSITTLAQIEKRTGISFLSGVNLDQTPDAQYWGITASKPMGDCSP